MAGKSSRAAVRWLQRSLLQVIRWQARTLGLPGTERLARRVYDPLRRVDDYVETVVPYSGGTRLHVDTRSFLEWSIYIHGRYEPDVARLLQAQVRPGDVALDVGANIGAFAVLLGALVGPRGRVYAFEPQPDIFERLRRNLELNSLSQVQAEPLALADAQRTEQLFAPLGANKGTASLRRIDDPAGVTTSLCPVETLDRFVAERRLPRVDWIKIDVEGAELAVLGGASRVLAEHRPRVIMEVASTHLERFGSTAGGVHAWLTEHDYLVYEIPRGRRRRPARVVAPPKESVFGQWIAKPSERVAHA
jgi:FkbM family methyltransferase